MFAEVCAGGVGLHLDDFGTGYSSLSALHRFPVDAIKIDRSFVADIADDVAGNEVIVRSTVAMAHSLGLPVIAEGIESPAQLRRLRALGCEFGQGHLFSPALSAHDTRALLNAGARPSSSRCSPPLSNRAAPRIRAVDDSEVAFDERGLVPCIVQDWRTGEVLTLAYMNAESLRPHPDDGRGPLLQPLPAGAVAQGRHLGQHPGGAGDPL